MTFLAAAMKRKTKKYRDEDEELTPWSLGKGIGKDMLSTWVSVLYPVFGSELWNAGSRIADKIEGSSGYTYDAFSVGVVDMINDLVSSGDKLFGDAGKLMRGEDVSLGDIGEHGLAMLLKGAKLAGIPADTVKTYYEGLMGNAKDLAEGRIPALNDESWERSAAVNAGRYLKAWIANDIDKVERVEQEMMQDYLDAGKSEEKANEAMKTKLTSTAKDALEDGTLDEQDAVDFLYETGYYSENDAWKTVKKWTVIAEHEDDEDFSYTQYTELFEAMDGNEDTSAIVRELTAHGVDEKNVTNAAKGHLVERFEQGQINETQFKNQLSRYCGIVGETANELTRNANVKRETGYSWDEMDNAYRDGNVSEASAKQMLTKYGGMSASEANAKVRYWDFQKAYPDANMKQETVDKYYNSDTLQNARISLDSFVKYYTQASKATGTDKDGDGRTDTGSKKEAILRIIDKLNLTDSQKDALYYYEGYSAKTINDAPWRKK